jgi:hypothetical protein
MTQSILATLSRGERLAIAGTYSLTLFENLCTLAYPALAGMAVDGLLKRSYRPQSRRQPRLMPAVMSSAASMRRVGSVVPASGRMMPRSWPSKRLRLLELSLRSRWLIR